MSFNVFNRLKCAFFWCAGSRSSGLLVLGFVLVLCYLCCCCCGSLLIGKFAAFQAQTLKSPLFLYTFKLFNRSNL